MASEALRSFCGCSLRLASQVIGAFDLVINFTIGTLHLTGTIVSGSNDVTIAIITISFLLATVSLLLIYAARHRRENLLIPWLLAKLLERCFVAVFIAAGLVHNDLGVISVTLILLGIIFAFYLWWVVCCYYIELKQGHPANCSGFQSRQISVEDTET